MNGRIIIFVKKPRRADIYVLIGGTLREPCILSFRVFFARTAELTELVITFISNTDIWYLILLPVISNCTDSWSLYGGIVCNLVTARTEMDIKRSNFKCVQTRKEQYKISHSPNLQFLYVNEFFINWTKRQLNLTIKLGLVTVCHIKSSGFHTISLNRRTFGFIADCNKISPSTGRNLFFYFC